MMRRAVMLLVALAGVACTEPVTDPNAVVALRFENLGYPSIVGGDSLRDSLGARLPLTATPLNYKDDPVDGAEVVFASPDTVLRILDAGTVFARTVRTDGAASLLYATVGSLQTAAETLFTVVRADSIRADRETQTMNVTSVGGVTLPDSLPFTVLGGTPTAEQPKVAVRSWLVSYQLRYKGSLLSPTDTTVAYTFWPTTGTNPRRILSSIDTTDQSGKATRGVFVRSTSIAQDTIYLIATVRRRQAGSTPKSDTTMILLQRP